MASRTLVNLIWRSHGKGNAEISNSFTCLWAVMTLAGCGPEERGTVQIVFNLADGEANSQLLSSEASI